MILDDLSPLLSLSLPTKVKTLPSLIRIPFFPQTVSQLYSRSLLGWQQALGIQKSTSVTNNVYYEIQMGFAPIYKNVDEGFEEEKEAKRKSGREVRGRKIPSRPTFWVGKSIQWEKGALKFPPYFPLTEKKGLPFLVHGARKSSLNKHSKPSTRDC
ncbi:hypothetical protein CDAR_532781 [Caerostris darwini]|uniref:Uncharacterized protein n=1 Tax=Caerostris darwini TaxID=1538125 RepID=A0AAV4VZH4_9ARAC|nr:hypothetical protein CDAR_532781 [Caerostris darwini]